MNDPLHDSDLNLQTRAVELRRQGRSYEAIADGLLRDDEVAAIAERANEARSRIGTAAEHYGPNCHPDRDAVDLHEAVREAERQRKG